jgi:hypothetical protein
VGLPPGTAGLVGEPGNSEPRPRLPAVGVGAVLGKSRVRERSLGKLLETPPSVFGFRNPLSSELAGKFAAAFGSAAPVLDAGDGLPKAVLASPEGAFARFGARRTAGRELLEFVGAPAGLSSLELAERLSAELVGGGCSRAELELG